MLWSLSLLFSLLLLCSLFIIVRLHKQVARLRQRLTRSRNKLNLILDNIDAHIYIKDQNLRYLYANQKMCEFFSLDPDEVIGKTDTEIGVDPEAAALLQENDLQVVNRGERVAIEENYHLNERKAPNTFYSIKFPLQKEEAQDGVLCGISTDITVYKATREANYQLAYFDPLTELPNRRLLLSRLKNMLQTAQRQKSIGAVLLIDLDNFKQINNARGHSMGDMVLKRVATRLSQLMRQHDTVARVGGDEFAILLTRLHEDLDQAKQTTHMISERVRKALEQPFLINSQAYLTSVSIGVSFIDAHTTNVEDVLSEADTAMYRSKDAGRNQVAFFHEKMKADVAERLDLRQDLDAAIGSDQLQPHLQPQLNQQREVVGVELLTRWTHPEQGVILPERFISVAEESQLISKLGNWTISQACQLLLRYPEQQFTVSVNISPAQFKQPDLFEQVENILGQYPVPSERLIFEITEGILLEDNPQSVKLVKALAKLGIRFAIDDFGTGYSNLASLKRLPLYELKIDQSLVRDIHVDRDSAMIVRTILAMGQQLRLHTVAEGVETESQALFLDQYGCSALQGHLFAPALSMPEWAAYIQTTSLR